MQQKDNRNLDITNLGVINSATLGGMVILTYDIPSSSIRVDMCPFSCLQTSFAISILLDTTPKILNAEPNLAFDELMQTKLGSETLKLVSTNHKTNRLLCHAILPVILKIAFTRWNPSLRYLLLSRSFNLATIKTSSQKYITILRH